MTGLYDMLMEAFKYSGWVGIFDNGVVAPVSSFITPPVRLKRSVVGRIRPSPPRDLSKFFRLGTRSAWARVFYLTAFPCTFIRANDNRKLECEVMTVGATVKKHGNVEPEGWLWLQRFAKEASKQTYCYFPYILEEDQERLEAFLAEAGIRLEKHTPPWFESERVRRSDKRPGRELERYFGFR